MFFAAKWISKSPTFSFRSPNGSKSSSRSFMDRVPSDRIKTAEEAVKAIESNDRVFIQTAACAPQTLVQAMTARAPQLRNVKICHLHTEGPAPYVEEKYKDSFKVTCFFVGANCRKAVQEGRAEFIPIFLSEVPTLFSKGILPLDFALVQVSPPDRHGYCSLGVSVDISSSAVRHAKHVIAQVNPNIPRTHGDGLLHIRQIDSFVPVNDPLPSIKPPTLSEVELAIGRNVASLVRDGATLQMGIGNIPDAVLASLGNHKRLGVHTEMFAEGVIDLVEKGVITNEEKNFHRGEIVSSFAMGTKRLYDWVDDNPYVKFLRIETVNDTWTIAQNPQVTAINSALEIDLTGQICADSIGGLIYSGIGGQMDFMRAAALSKGGKPIIALTSTAKEFSRIVTTLKPGAGVVTTRAHAHYVVTEYGVAQLFGKSLSERAEALISISHPQHRDKLRWSYNNQYWKKCQDN